MRKGLVTFGPNVVPFHTLAKYSVSILVQARFIQKLCAYKIILSHTKLCLYIDFHTTGMYIYIHTKICRYRDIHTKMMYIYRLSHKNYVHMDFHTEIMYI